MAGVGGVRWRCINGGGGGGEVSRLEFEGLLEDLSLAAVGVQGRGGGAAGD
jgi:hypothetical protein